MGKRVIPRPPIVEVVDGVVKTNIYKCPKCERKLFTTQNGGATGCRKRYCCDCGQRLLWKGVKIETYWPYEEID